MIWIWVVASLQQSALFSASSLIGPCAHIIHGEDLIPPRGWGQGERGTKILKRSSLSQRRPLFLRAERFTVWPLLTNSISSWPISTFHWFRSPARFCDGQHRFTWVSLLKFGGSAMSKTDGFPQAVAVWLGLAFATALSLLMAFAFGGLPWP